MWFSQKDFPRTAFDVNIQGTFNVLEACVNNIIERLIYSSSASVYGDAVKVPMMKSSLFTIETFMEPLRLPVKLCVVHFTIVMA